MLLFVIVGSTTGAALVRVLGGLAAYVRAIRRARNGGLQRREQRADQPSQRSWPNRPRTTRSSCRSRPVRGARPPCPPSWWQFTRPGSLRRWWLRRLVTCRGRSRGDHRLRTRDPSHPARRQPTVAASASGSPLAPVGTGGMPAGRLAVSAPPLKALGAGGPRCRPCPHQSVRSCPGRSVGRSADAPPPAG